MPTETLNEIMVSKIEQWIKDYEKGEGEDTELLLTARDILCEVKDSLELGEY